MCISQGRLIFEMALLDLGVLTLQVVYTDQNMGPAAFITSGDVTMVSC